jgi:hypothetical protein
LSHSELVFTYISPHAQVMGTLRTRDKTTRSVVDLWRRQDSSAAAVLASCPDADVVLDVLAQFSERAPALSLAHAALILPRLALLLPALSGTRCVQACRAAETFVTAFGPMVISRLAAAPADSDKVPVSHLDRLDRCRAVHNGLKQLRSALTAASALSSGHPAADRQAAAAALRLIEKILGPA